MASDGAGKIKQKRSHLNSKPYQRRQSFFGRVRDTVSSISYVPSFFASAMSKVKKTVLPKPEVNFSNSDVAVEVEEDMFLTPHQLPDEPVHDGYVSRPQPHRLSLPARVANNGPRVPLLLSNTQHSTPIPTRQYPKIPEKHPPPVPVVMQNDYGFDVDDEVMCDDEPSRIQQLVDSTDKLEPLHLDESRVQKLKTNLQPAFSEPERYTMEEKLAAREGKNTQLRRTWSERHNASLQTQTTMRNRPSFNTSLFGSPLNNTNVLSESFHESSFYPGKTTFGGSSTSQKKGRLNSTAPYQTSLPIRKQIKAKPLKSSYDMVTSSTARKILETLERMSTPLSDAKKIPANESCLSDSVLSFAPASYRRPPRPNSNTLTARRSSLEAPIRGPPTSQRSIVGQASIAKNRQTFLPPQNAPLSREVMEQSSRDDNVEPPRVPPPTSHIISIGSATNRVTPSLLRSETVTIKEPVGLQSGGKMKKEKSYHKSSKQTVEEEIEVPDLRTDFTLPVNCMPAFNFQGPSPKTVSNSTAEKSIFSTPAMTDNKLTPTAVRNTDAMCSKFKFSTPISTGKPSPTGSPQKVEFIFSSPIDASEKSNAVTATTGFQQKSSPVKSGFQFGVSVGEFSQSGHPSRDSPAASPSNPVASPSIGGFKAAATLKTGSVMDMLSSSSPAAPLETQKQGTVMDRLGSPKNVPSTSSVKTVPQLKQGSVMDILGKGGSQSEKNNNKLPAAFQQPKPFSSGGSWNCETCMVQNKSESTTCVCCQALKPSSKAQDVNQKNFSKADDLLAKFMKPPGTWECDACMVQNKTDATSCIACQTAKTDPAMSMKKTPISNSLSTVSKATSTWECDTCLVQNKPAATRCIACETAKPGAEKTKVAVEWECDTCLVQNKAIATKCIACETPRTGSKPLGGLKSGLTFNSAPSSGFKLPATNSTSTSNISTGGFKLPTSDTTSPVGGGFKFGNEQSSGISNSNSISNTGFSFSQKTEDVKIKSENGPVNSTESKALVGGFSLTQFNTPTSSASEKKPENAMTGGFKFGDKENAAPSGLGFSFANNKSTNVNSSTKVSTDAVKGGFTFGTSMSATVDTKLKNDTLGQNVSFAEKSFSSSSHGTSSPLETVLAKPSSGGISLGRPVHPPKTETVQLSQEETKPETNKSGFGGFTFGAATKQLKAEPANEAFGGFNFAKPENKTAVSSTFGNSPAIPASSDQKAGFTFQPSATDNVLKRNREETDAESKGAKKFSFGSSGTAPQANLFAFGQTASASPAVFSAAGASSSKQPALPAFGSFSSATQPDKKPTPASSPFSFNASVPNTTTSTATPLSIAPAFGTSTTPTSFGKSSVSAPLSFGSAASSGSAAFTGFGSIESSQKPAAAGLAFAGTSSSAFGTSNATGIAASSGFNFSSANSAPAPSFGVPATTSGAAGGFNAAPSFNFTASAPPASVFQFGGKPDSVSSTQNAGFNFGGQNPGSSAPPTFNATPSFNFNAAAPSNFAFSANTAANEAGSGGRRIKKAVRKIRK